jgi:hypothetical protein
MTVFVIFLTGMCVGATMGVLAMTTVMTGNGRTYPRRIR